MSWIMGNWASFHYILATLLCCLFRTSNNVILSICSTKKKPIGWQIYTNCCCCCLTTAALLHLKWKSFPYLILSRHTMSDGQTETFCRKVGCGIKTEISIWIHERSFAWGVWVVLSILFVQSHEWRGKKSNKVGHARRVINLEHWNTQLLLLKAMLDYGLLSLVFRTLSFDIWCVCVCVFMIGVIRGLSVILPLYFCFQPAVAATN